MPRPPSSCASCARCATTHGIVLIADEIQSGFARTGRMFAIEHSGVEPDLMTVAKSIAGGVPLSAVIGKAEIMDAPPPGGLGGTYAGSPLACAAGLAVLEVIREEQLAEARAANRPLHEHAPEGTAGALSVHRRSARTGRHGRRSNWSRTAAPISPDAELTKALVQAAGRQGLIILSCGIYCQRDPFPCAADDPRCAC